MNRQRLTDIVDFLFGDENPEDPRCQKLVADYRERDPELLAELRELNRRLVRGFSRPRSSEKLNKQWEMLQARVNAQALDDDETNEATKAIAQQAVSTVGDPTRRGTVVQAVHQGDLFRILLELLRRRVKHPLIHFSPEELREYGNDEEINRYFDMLLENIRVVRESTLEVTRQFGDHRIVLVADLSLRGYSKQKIVEKVDGVLPTWIDFALRNVANKLAAKSSLLDSPLA